MSYESNPGGLGVGKRYGPLNLGGVIGKLSTFGRTDEVTFFVTTEELSSDAAQTISVPAYSEVVGVWVQVDDAFGALDTLSITLGGNAITAAAIPVSAAGIFDPALHATAANIQTGAIAEDIALDTTLVDSGVLGSCKIVVEIKQV